MKGFFINNDFAVFFKFSIVNGLITVFNFLLYALFNEIFAMWYVLSSISSYIISVGLSSIINSRYVFAGGKGRKEIYRYFLMKVVLGVLSSIVLYTLVDIGGLNKYVGMFSVTGIFFITSYFLSRSVFESGNMVNQVIKLLRIKHWIKNILIFIPLMCSGKVFQDRNRLYSLVIVFIGVCFVSSAIYVGNDIADIGRDRLNPNKKDRPLASGLVSVKQAKAYLLMCCILGLIAFLLLYCAIPLKNWIISVSLVSVYLIINILYSRFNLKDIPILEMAMVVSGYMIRLMVGAYTLEIPISSFLALTTFSIAWYLVSAKRYSELKNYGDISRKSLSMYSDTYLLHITNTASAMMLIFFSLWALERFEFFYTVFLIIGTVAIYTLYSYDLDRYRDGDPVTVLFKDKILLVICLVYSCIVVGVMLVV